MITPKTLREEHGGNWGEHPKYLAKDWQYEVANEDTRRGYWEWVCAKIEEEDDEREQTGRG